MASTQQLSAAAQDRKSRLAQLKSLKRKQPPQDDSEEQPSQTEEDPTPTDSPKPAYLSGRNYDPTTKGAKLGFESAPSANQTTLELQAAALAAETKRQAEAEEKADKPLDLFKLQPKKPNWDLKRDLERKLEVLGVRTDNAVARLVRERIERAKVKSGGGDGEAAGIEGTTLVEAANVREREDEEEARRERAEEEALLDGS